MQEHAVNTIGKTLLVTLALAITFMHAPVSHAAEQPSGKNGTVTFTIAPTVDKATKTTRVWLPYPVSNKAQTISDLNVQGNFKNSAVYRDAQSGALFLHADWPVVTEQPKLVMSFHVALSSRKVDAINESSLPIPEPIRKQYLESTPQIPARMFAKQAQDIIAGKTTLLEKARAVYDWTVDNTHRDPNVVGCGLGVPGRTLEDCEGGGKCADISAVFVTMARAAGIPARDVYGLRLGSPKNGNITSAFHCWAEFYLPGTGWVPVDPADVRKMMLVHDLKLGDKAAEEWREFFWGGDDLFRVTLNKESRGVVLTPRQNGAPINYFMYPFAQVDGKSLNYFTPEAFTYSVTFTAD